MNGDLETIKGILPFLIPLVILELGLMIFALVDLIRRKAVRGGNKIIWALVIVLFQIFGPIIYLVIGRKETVDDSD